MWPGAVLTQRRVDEKKRLEGREEQIHHTLPCRRLWEEEETHILRWSSYIRRRLQEVEKKLAQETRTQVLKTVSVEPGGGTGRLGPCVVAEVSVNGVPTKALVDTGSPATIVALEFVIDIFVRERRDHQTPAQWRAETLTKFSPPSVLLKAYSGHKLNILSQVCLQLKHGSRTVKATVLVQEGAPTKLLLGTDLQSQLGFSLLAETGTTLTDLLTGEVCSQEPESSDAPEKRMRHGEPDDSGTTHDLKKVGGAKQYRYDSNTGLRRGVPDHPPSQTIRLAEPSSDVRSSISGQTAQRGFPVTREVSAKQSDITESESARLVTLVSPEAVPRPEDTNPAEPQAEMTITEENLRGNSNCRDHPDRSPGNTQSLLSTVREGQRQSIGPPGSCKNGHMLLQRSCQPLRKPCDHQELESHTMTRQRETEEKLRQQCHHVTPPEAPDIQVERTVSDVQSGTQSSTTLGRSDPDDDLLITAFGGESQPTTVGPDSAGGNDTPTLKVCVGTPDHSSGGAVQPVAGDHYTVR